MSTIRVPPNEVRSTTMPCGSSRMSPMSVASAPSRWPRRRRGRRRPPWRPPPPRTCPRWRHRAGSMPSRSHAPATAGRIGRAASSSTTARPQSWASSLHTVPTPPRVGSRSQRVGRCRGEQGLDELGERRCVGADVALDGEVTSGQHDGHPVIGDGARDEDAIAAPDEVGTEVPVSRHDADRRRWSHRARRPRPVRRPWCPR